MHRTVEAVVDEHGNIRLLETVPLPTGRRVLVTILEEQQFVPIDEVTLLSEAALAEDWSRPEEDAAWSHLQPVR
jgi:predicted DNA-binding antitoxin AbrB/MazE fold protein